MLKLQGELENQKEKNFALNQKMSFDNNEILDCRSEEALEKKEREIFSLKEKIFNLKIELNAIKDNEKGLSNSKNALSLKRHYSTFLLSDESNPNVKE